MRRFALVLCLTACGGDGETPVDAPPPPPPDAPPAWTPPDAAPTPACADEMDNDGDGLVDFPFECGCVSLADGDETDPAPLSACCDGVDNDADGFTDYPEDPACAAASDETEFNIPAGECGPAIVVQPLELPATISAEMTAGEDELFGACGGYGRELVWRFLLTETATVTITDSGTADVVLSVREICLNLATEVGCTDDPETLVLPDLPPDDYYLIVDGFGPGSLGTVELTVEVL